MSPLIALRRTGATQHLDRFLIVEAVSILARPEGRALSGPISRATLGISFQSSPAPKDGRYTDSHLAIGRLKVSILARPEGRALLGQLDQPGEFISFNPRPPRRTGATCDRRGRETGVCFNPRPPRRTGAKGLK